MGYNAIPEPRATPPWSPRRSLAAKAAAARAARGAITVAPDARRTAAALTESPLTPNEAHRRRRLFMESHRFGHGTRRRGPEARLRQDIRRRIRLEERGGKLRRPVTAEERKLVGL